MIAPYQYVKNFLIPSHNRVAFCCKIYNNSFNSTQGHLFAITALNDMVHVSLCTCVICRMKFVEVGLLGQSLYICAFVILIDTAKCFSIKAVPAGADFPKLPLKLY